MILKNYLCNSLYKFLIKFESMSRHQIKEQTPQLTLLYCGRTVRSSHWRFSIKELILKNSHYPQETPVLESLFRKAVGLKAINFIKRYPNTGACLRILQNFQDYLFQKTSANGCFFIVSMFDSYMGLRVKGLGCMATSGFRI